MVKFIDINTGNVYDGSKPYTHWFEGRQSVGLNYDKQFIVLADTDRLEIQLDSEVFFLVDDTRIQNGSAPADLKEKEYDKEYLDLDKIKTNSLVRTVEDSVLFSNYYIYSFSVIACGEYVGEVRDSFYINGEEFEIGADFLDENEALGINLTNFGAEISNEIQRAIYEKNINEQKVDWVLLNRKFKELLNEYIGVLGNKGSYKSLINSLKWFEYGDLVKIYEYWKHPEPNHDYLSKRDLTQFITKESEYLLYTLQKTTYIGISCALEKVMKELDGTTQYEDYIEQQHLTDPVRLLDEPNPKLEWVSMLWSKNEMQLKMTLLGNFFATYFMPIHLDLIHSTVEDIVYAQTIKLIYLPKLERTDIFDEINTLYCDIKPLYHLSNVETYTNPKTPFGFIHRTEFTPEDEELSILGVDTKLDDTASDLDQLKTYAMQHFKGIGAVIPFHCTLENVIGSACITAGYINVHKGHMEKIGGKDKIVWDWVKDRGTENITHFPQDGNVYIDFNLLVQQTGIYRVQLEFRRSDGVKYIKVVDFTVDDESYPTLKMYRLIPKDAFNWSTNALKKWIEEGDDDKAIELGNIADYVLNPVQYRSMIEGSTIKEQPLSYIQFIAAPTKTLTENVFDKRVHTNQVIIITGVPDGAEPTVRFRAIGDPEIAGKSKEDLETFGFVWIEMNRYGHLIKNDDPNVLAHLGGGIHRYIIGINKNPNIDSVIKWEVDTNPDKEKLWIRDMFIPYFYKLEDLGEVSFNDVLLDNLSQEEIFHRRNSSLTYELEPTDVVCFLPSIKCIRRPKDFMWKYTCSSTEQEITPIKFRNLDAEVLYDGDIAVKVKTNDNRIKDKTPFPTILQPLFGRYDFRILPSPGYYDLELNYKLDDGEDNITKTVKSQFLVKRPDKS